MRRVPVVPIVLVVALVVAAPTIAADPVVASQATLAAMKQVKELVHETHMSTIGERHEVNGFRGFHSVTERGESVVASSDMAVADVEKALVHFGNEYQGLLEGLDQVRNGLRFKYTFVAQRIAFKSGRGRGGFLSFVIQQVGEGFHAGRWEVSYIASTCDFEPAPAYAIITDSDSGLFESSTTQRIQEYPADFKPEHLQNVADLLSGKFAARLLLAAS